MSVGQKNALKKKSTAEKYNFCRVVRMNAMNRNILLNQVKNKVQEVSPGAEVILYGSKVRETEHSDSDWDFLILTDINSNELTDRIRHKIYEVECETGEVLSSIVRSRREWNSRRYRLLPFHQNIDKEGVKV
jgi:predicted nucleotidyltransferase